ncbi:HNH endonuclease-domain-containing protein [Tuber borchii]|uniref:HNH endonuclease-domain-containing protein n=1 Tax=Tuber borchii TaxID=42251 RepID=A0A2T6ZY44_TUBBO|nr:HNH endonuclease-domain-containing protein [Tuber borchii]
MEPENRAGGRDTFIYDSNHRDTLLGGLWIAEGTTNANLYCMVEIICNFTDTFDLRDNNEQLVIRDEKPLQPGNYFIVTNVRKQVLRPVATTGFAMRDITPSAALSYHGHCSLQTGSITLTEEAPLFRGLSLESGARIVSFRDAVRERDRRCVITRVPVYEPAFSGWKMFEVAHIFPLAYEDHWNQSNYSRWITVPPANESDGFIHSVQNGMLLTRDLHALFDGYDVSINPDDNYKIVCFARETTWYNIAGRHLDQTFLDNPLRPADQLLRWHYRQAVLVNVKGLGEPCVEMDFPLGLDVMAEIMDDPKPVERMEFELFSRFNAKRSRA